MFDIILKILGIRKFDTGIANFGSDLIAVRKDGKWGLTINQEMVVIPFEYDEIERARDAQGEIHTDHFLVHLGEKMGLYSIGERRLVIPVEYARISEFAGLHSVWSEFKSEDESVFKCGLFSVEKGELVLATEYSGFRYSGGAKSEFVTVDMGNKQGLFSVRENRMLVPPVYYHIYSYYDEPLFRIATANSKSGNRREGLYLIESDIIVEPEFEDIESPGAYGFVKEIQAIPFRKNSYQKNETTGLISLKTGEVLLDAIYKKIQIKGPDSFELFKQKGEPPESFSTQSMQMC
jgi:hypothetical protein